MSTENKKELDNCYKGLFWDLETQMYLRWEDFKKKKEDKIEQNR